MSLEESSPVAQKSPLYVAKDSLESVFGQIWEAVKKVIETGYDGFIKTKEKYFPPQEQKRPDVREAEYVKSSGSEADGSGLSNRSSGIGAVKISEVFGYSKNQLESLGEVIMRKVVQVYQSIPGIQKPGDILQNSSPEKKEN